MTTDTTDLKMTEDALAEETAAFKDTTQDCLAIQAKVADFEATNNSPSEELEAFAKAKAVISEKTDDAEYRDNGSVLSSRGWVAIKFTKSEHSIELAQLPSHVVFAMHAETSNDDDPFAKVKGLISDMIARLEEKASADATHNATSNVYTVVHRMDGLKTIAKRVQGVSQLFSLFDETYYPEDSETEMMRYMTMLQHKDLSLTISMISLGPGIMKLNLVVYLVSYSWPEVINIMLMCDMKIKSRQSQGVSLKKFMSAQHRNQTEDVKENKLKGLIIVNIEMFAMKSCKCPVYFRWNDWQSIVIETEYGYAWMDKADENSQCLETYDAMRKTTESEREAKDQIMVQINKHVRNGGRRYCQILVLLSKFGFLEGPKVETEIFSVKMHQTEAISWNKTKSGDDAAEKFDSQESNHRSHTIARERVRTIEQVIPDLPAK